MRKLTTEQREDKKRRQQFRARHKLPKIIKALPVIPLPKQVQQGAALANAFYGDALRSYKVTLCIEKAIFSLLADIRDLKSQIKRDRPTLFPNEH
jgi:hypothetical protein